MMPLCVSWCSDDLQRRTSFLRSTQAVSLFSDRDPNNAPSAEEFAGVGLFGGSLALGAASIACGVYAMAWSCVAAINIYTAAVLLIWRSSTAKCTRHNY